MTLQKKNVSTLLHLLAPFLFVRDSVCFTCVWARKSLKYWQSFTISFIPLPPNTPSPGISSIIDQNFHSKKRIKSEQKSTKSWILWRHFFSFLVFDMNWLVHSGGCHVSLDRYPSLVSIYLIQSSVHIGPTWNWYNSNVVINHKMIWFCILCTFHNVNITFFVSPLCLLWLFHHYYPFWTWCGTLRLWEIA